MSRLSTQPFEDSIANALGVLYERKARGTRLIRVLEDYRRFRLKAPMKPSPRTWKAACQCTPVASHHELERLYLRRAAVDQVIRSIEAYTGSKNLVSSHR
jgi:hypothetical protein